MFFDEKILQSTTIPWQKALAVVNPDWSSIWGGAVETTPYTMVAYYDTSNPTYNYEYYCEANSWTALSASLWRIFRIKNDKEWVFQTKEWAWTWFTRQATDLATVAAYPYS